MKPAHDETAEKTRAILNKVRQIEIRTNRLVNDTLAGEYHSAFKGQGMNFDEVREYHTGDEVRNIDWNVTARIGKPFVKKFVEERETTILLMIDVSASGFYGSGEQTKRDLAAEVGSMFAYSAIRNKDKVGLVLFSDRVEHFLPPQKGNNHVLRVIRDILFFEPKHKRTNIAAALDYANQVLHRKAIILLISDFCLNDPAESAMSRLMTKLDLTHHKHDLVVFSIGDPIERSMLPSGLLMVEDIETGEQILLDARSPSTLERYRELAIRENEQRRNLFRKRGIDLIELETGRPYIKDIIRFFKNRERRRRKI